MSVHVLYKLQVSISCSVAEHSMERRCFGSRRGGVAGTAHVPLEQD
jgi:hypothetical protein